MKRVLLGAVLAAAGLALGGCGSSHRSVGRQASVNQQALVVMRRLARCIRTHGMAAFPDPVVDSAGHPTYPDSSPRIPASIQQACNAIAAQMPPQYTATTPVSNADFQKLLVLARCMRMHGIPDWPDPNALGEFPIDTRVQHQGKRVFMTTLHACARLNPNPSGGIDLVQARP
jgi:hypothetical protein